jgi:hypothetical protein
MLWGATFLFLDHIWSLQNVSYSLIPPVSPLIPYKSIAFIACWLAWPYFETED